jgi:hypothetical protein
MASPFTDKMHVQVRQAIEVMTAWVEGDDGGQRLALNVMAAQLVEGGSQALADLSIGLGLPVRTLLARLELIEGCSEQAILPAMALGFLRGIPPG